MMRFAEKFADHSIVATLSPQLSWSHIIELLTIKTDEARIFLLAIMSIIIKTSCDG